MVVSGGMLVMCRMMGLVWRKLAVVRVECEVWEGLLDSGGGDVGGRERRVPSCGSRRPLLVRIRA